MHAECLVLADLLEEEVQCLGLLTVVGDADAGAGDDLAGVALSIDLAQTSPLAELGVVIDFEEVDGMLGAEGLDELLVGRLGAVLGQHASTLADATGEAIMAQSILEHALESGDSVERLALNDWLLSDDWCFDFRGFFDVHVALVGLLTGQL